MRRVAALVVIVCAAGVVGAGVASSGSAAKRPRACQMLAAALKSTTFDTRVSLDPGSTAIQCSHSDRKPVTKSKWQISIFFVPYPSVATAKKGWEASYKQARAGSGPPPVRLRSIGADDAWGNEGVNPNALAGSLSSASISWRKGVYLGTFGITAPTASNLGDLEEAEDLIPDALRILPRR